jgi:2-phosphosulfolactate phosphatase
MKVRVIFSHNNIDELYFTGKTTVVIDVLRATTTIVTALNNGAREVIPVATVDFAMKVSGNIFSGMTLLGGERNTKMIEGFHLGNSPLEYKEEVVNGKTIILYTTNGSRAVVKAKFSENLFICSFNNLASIASHLNRLKKDVEILCSGTNGFFSLEDVACAGRLISEMQIGQPDIDLYDSGRASLTLSKTFGKSTLKLLKETEHGRLLVENGFVEDIKYCAKISNIDVVPYFTSGSIKKLDLNNFDNLN